MYASVGGLTFCTSPFSLVHSRPASPGRTRHHVEGDGASDSEARVHLRSDLDAIGVSDAEPPFRDLGDALAVAHHAVLVVEDVPLDLDVRHPRDTDSEPVADRADNGFLHRRNPFSVLLHRHRVPDMDNLLLDFVLVAGFEVPHFQRVANAECLPVDDEYLLAGLVFDVVVVTDRGESLGHLVAAPLAFFADSSTAALVASVPSSFLSLCSSAHVRRYACSQHQRPVPLSGISPPRDGPPGTDRPPFQGDLDERFQVV
jgi:hypothetical protein